MDEAQGLCMEGHAVDGRTFCTVTPVTGYRMTEILHVDADLIFTSGVERDFHERIAVAAFKSLVAGYGQLSLFGILCGIDLVAGILCKIALDCTLCGIRTAFDYGKLFTREHHVVPVVLQTLLRFL